MERWENGEAELLSSCYKNSLTIAVEHGAKSIAFPSISTGIYRFPKEEAAKTAVAEVVHLKKVII